MSLSYTDITAAYPEFEGKAAAAAGQTQINTALSIATKVVAAGVLKTTAHTTAARLALAAHLASLYFRGCNEQYNGTGSVTGRTRGDRSVSYTDPAAYQREGVLKSTIYGVQYLLLMRGGRHRRPIAG